MIVEKDGALTPICPRCSIVAVLGDASGLEISTDFFDNYKLAIIPAGITAYLTNKVRVW
jgi:hypothetical protein